MTDVVPQRYVISNITAGNSNSSINKIYPWKVLKNLKIIILYFQFPKLIIKALYMSYY